MLNIQTVFFSPPPNSGGGGGGDVSRHTIIILCATPNYIHLSANFPLSAQLHNKN